MLTTGVDSDQRRALVAALRDYVKREVGSPEQRQRISPDTEDTQVLRDVTRSLAELGWVGVALPEEYGGGGGGITDACLIMEELWYGRVPAAAVIVSMIVGKVIETFGTPEQKERVISGICRGEIASIAMSEPGAGSDVGSLTCRAVPTADGYVLNGQKTWTSAAHYADRILLVARTSVDGTKHQGLSMLEVPAGTAGMTIRPIATLGGSEVNDIYFTDAFVPRENLVGVQDQGWGQLMSGLNFERLVGAAGFLGLTRRIFDDTVEHITGRQQFGQPISKFQAIRHRVADLATEIECCRMLVYELAARADANPGTAYLREVSMAKLKTSEVLKTMAVEGMQMTGGMGYTKEFGMEAHLRHGIIATVYGGASEVQRDIIAKTFEL
ncbi:acyl-CoA dehydrogenase family protein [Pseudonocardia pini]|uniref:acyl-CoA dehydrogenase family protein n=1 Tax=Pseudonocardia pini TaxID=2758030 RepID=UPI0028AFD3DD|nr:acyl-CoA dehydrogenase family protein [Pseudonocardia pini]